MKGDIMKIFKRKIDFSISFKWFDIWVGIFIKKQFIREGWNIYICPIPTICIKIDIYNYQKELPF